MRFGGYLGAEFRNVTFPGERAAALAAMNAYLACQLDGARLRALAPFDPQAPGAVRHRHRAGPAGLGVHPLRPGAGRGHRLSQRAFTAAVAAHEAVPDGAAYGLSHDGRRARVIVTRPAGAREVLRAALGRDLPAGPA